MGRPAGISWDWSESGRGALCTLPAAAVLLTVDVSLGLFVALGSLPVAMLGVPPRRSARPRLVLIGAAFAAAYALGSVIGQAEVAAVAFLVLLAYAGVLLAATGRPAARLLPALLLPAFALGMNEPPRDGLVLAAVFLAGGAWATLVTCAWPQSAAPVVAARPEPPSAGRATRVYAILFAAAAGIGLAVGYLLDLDHVAWAAAAAMFIMRPDPELLASRAVGRVVSTFAGVIAAGLIVRRGPAEIVLAVIVVAAISAMLAARSSRWYVAPAGSGLVVLLASGVSGADEFAISFVDRLLETAVGAALALVCGVAVPGVLRRLAGPAADVDGSAA